jgi:hypothetical protein
VLGACWRRKFWDLSAIMKAKWNKGKKVCQKRRKSNATKGKGRSMPGKKEDQCKEQWDRRPTTLKEVRKWTSGVHLEIRVFVNERVLTHLL